MDLKMVTYTLSLTQFLVDAQDNEAAIQQAIEANLSPEIGPLYEDERLEVSDPANYEVDPVNDFQMLSEIMDRVDRYGRVEKAIVFWN